MRNRCCHQTKRIQTRQIQALSKTTHWIQVGLPQTRNRQLGKPWNPSPAGNHRVNSRGQNRHNPKSTPRSHRLKKNSRRSRERKISSTRLPSGCIQNLAQGFPSDRNSTKSSRFCSGRPRNASWHASMHSGRTPVASRTLSSRHPTSNPSPL